MIASERIQNIILVVTIITAIISSGFLVGNAAYYGGSYALAGRLEVNLTDIHVSNVNPTNETLNPGVVLTFTLATSAETEGNVRITFMGAALTLNDDILSYMAFAYTPAVVNQYLYPSFNVSVSMSQTANEDADRHTIIDAYLADTWHWEIVFRYSFIIFDEPGSIMWRYIYFNTTQFTLT
ncbi:MAG: hypothetical protein JW779_04615 [Candidatus Thorarchaeota archaeon]|nr:hypothetical protein [Candidatus Thorarchaeota archaeon]